LLQRGIPIAVESTNEEHMRANLEAFDFWLQAPDMAALDAFEWPTPLLNDDGSRLSNLTCSR